MPSPATVLILFVVSLAATAASGVMPPDLFVEITARLDDFAHLAACSLASRALAEVTATARAVGRLFYDQNLCPDDLPALVTRICRSRDAQVQKLLLREAQYDEVVGLVDRLLLSRSSTEFVVAEALSLLVSTVGPVAADAISGTVFPANNDDEDGSERLCHIRAQVQGLDFTLVPMDDLPPAVLRHVEMFVVASQRQHYDNTGAGEPEVVPLQYAAPFDGVFPNNAALSDCLLSVPEIRAALRTRPDLLRLIPFGVRFDGGAFFGAVSVPGSVVAQIYPLLRKGPQTDWFKAVCTMIERDDLRAIDALFRIDDFAKRLSAAPDAETRFLGLCADAVKQRRDTIFTVLVRHPLMEKVINMRVAESFDRRSGTLLHLAVRLNRVAMVAILLSFAGLQMSVQDSRRHTAMHYAWRPRIRGMLLRELYVRNVVYGQELPRLGWYNRVLLDSIF